MSLPRSSLDFQKNDTSHENISHACLLLSKSIWLAAHRYRGHCGGGTMGSLGLEMTSPWSSCFVAFSKF